MAKVETKEAPKQQEPNTPIPLQGKTTKLPDGTIRTDH